MKFNNYNKNEPSSFTYLKKKLDVSVDEFRKSLTEENIDAHSQIKIAKLYAHRLDTFIKDHLNRKNERILDCGCGLGFIARELNKFGGFNIDYCDPSDSVSDIHRKAFPSENFFQSDIESLDKFKKKYDIIYLREVYPFTRDANFSNQKKLIDILINKLRTNGLLIFEQIENKEDLFVNLRKLNYKFEILSLLPIRFAKKKFLNKIIFKSNKIQLLLRMVYKLMKKNINHFILIYQK